MKHILAAFKFLTILPMPGGNANDGKDLQKSLVYFPFVGLVLGAFTSLTSVLLLLIFPPLVTATLLTLFLTACSGGLHMDGLADTADGFFSSRPRERILEIMRDSCIGSMGTLAIIFVVCIKIFSLASIQEGHVWKAILLMPIAGRSILVMMTTMYSYARTDGGIVTPFLNDSKILPISIACSTLLLCGALSSGIILGIFCVLAILIINLLFGFYCKKKIGGITGDTLGCSCEIAEAAIALLFACNLVSM